MNKRQKKALVITSITFILIAFLIMLQQLITWGHTWEWDDFLHHEVIAAILVTAAVTMLSILAVLRKKRKI